MLGALAVVAFISTTGSYGMLCTEKVFQEAFSMEAKPIAAEFINVDHAIPLRKPTYDGRNGVIFYSDPSPPPQPIDLPPKMKDFYCENNNGILLRFQNQIPDQLVACKVVAFRCALELFQENSVLSYCTLYFQYGYEGPVGLIVPICQKPTLQGRNERQWAEVNKAALLDPDVGKIFKDAFDGTPAFLRLSWLNDALPYGVFKNKKQLTLNGKKLSSFVTRPVLFSKSTMKAFLLGMVSVKRKSTESDITNSKLDEIKLADTNLDDTIVYNYGLNSSTLDGPFLDSTYDQDIADVDLLRDAILEETRDIVTYFDDDHI